MLYLDFRFLYIFYFTVILHLLLLYLNFDKYYNVEQMGFINLKEFK